MHKEERTQSSVFNKCSAEGSFVALAKTDYAKIKSMVSIALLDLETVNTWKQKAPKESGQWNALLKLGYDVLHVLCEAVLLCDKMKARTHECVFAFFCEKHPELEFDWNFFDKIRTIRNRSVYYGKKATYDDWKSVELQLNLYIKTLEKEIEKKLKEV